MEEIIDNIEIVFKLCGKTDAECLSEQGNTVEYQYDGGKIARFITNQRRKDFMVDIFCLKTETAFFANNFVPKWHAIIDSDIIIGNVVGNVE